jgi:2-dehydropantoate 2-reductase
MEFCIIGAGAIGGITGVQLACAGHGVSFVESNPAHVEAVRAGGLRLTGAVEATIHPEILLPQEVRGPLRHVLLAVKSRHTAEALAPLAPLLAPDGYVVSLQNGLEERKIARLVGAHRTIGASLTFGGHWRAPGLVVYGGPGTFRIGELDRAITPRLLALRDALAAVQKLEVTANIFGYLWAKMALGAAYFATATTDSDVTDLYAEPRWRCLLGRVVGEVVMVAEADGVAVEPFDGFDAGAFGPHGPRDAAGADASWQGQVRYWNRHAGKRTGIWRDLAIHQRRTEVDRLVGEVVSVAEARGLAVPGIRRLVGLIRDIEEGRRPQSLDNLALLEQAMPPGDPEAG